jgi:hypothetical protein
MKLQAEYTITIKLDNVYMPPNSSEEETKEWIQTLGMDNLRKYFNGMIFDPDKKIIKEEIKYQNK